MASALSHRLRRLEGKLRPDATQFIIIAPPSIQDEERWLREYAPQYKEWRDERKQRMGPTQAVIYPSSPDSYVWHREQVRVGDATRVHELQQIGGQLITASGNPLEP